MRDCQIPLESRGSQAGRLHNLDYLRGMAAFGIMVYHYLTWSIGEFPAETFMGRLGLYGVSIFYVLSGLTLYFVYFNKLPFTVRGVSHFFEKRILRIFPLLWLVTISSIVLSRTVPNFYDLALNLTGLFGFFKWDTYFSPGIWSIGNELVFYTLFPFFVFFARFNKVLLLFLSIAIFLLYMYFSFIKIDTHSSLSSQWSVYINPLNQAFLFLGGFLIGLFFSKIRLSNVLSTGLILLGLGIFLLLPASGDGIHLVAGWRRLAFTLCCFFICTGFYKMSLEFPAMLHKPLTVLGETSYSLYLLHPLVWAVMGIVLKILAKASIVVPMTLKLTIAVLLTVIISYFTYQYFEKYFMRLARARSDGKDHRSGRAVSLKER